MTTTTVPAPAASKAGPRRFEGGSVEEVLAEVRRTLGPDAEIVEANKVRSGGIGGFFAKETYEVVARPRGARGRAARPGDATPADGLLPPGIDEGAFDRAAAHVAAIRGASSLLGLADQVSDAERGAAPFPRPTPTPGPTADPGTTAATRSTAAPRSTDGPSPSAGTNPANTSEQGWQPPTATMATPPSARPADASAAFEPMAVEEMPRLSTEGGAFNDVLHRIATEAGPDIADAIDRRLGSPLSVDVGDPAGRDQRPLRPVGPQARTRAEQAADQAQHMSRPLHDPLHSHQVQAPSTHLVPAPQPDASHLPAPHHAPEDVLDLVHAHTPDVVETTPMRSQPESRTERLLSWLERDNLPRTTLMTALRGLPDIPALPASTGVVVAVVGRRADALRLCRQLAKAHDSGPDQVVLASADYKGRSIPADRRIIDLTDATRERRAWRRRGTPTFVAIDTPTAVGADGLAWTREIVAELEVHQVIGVVSAARKVTDVATWAERIGGVDALALRELHETSTPHDLLALEIPVAFLEDSPATPGTWAQLLLEGSTP